ncbi:MAG: T9SS type A sorting domain-containing protein, partial [Chitinophagales bacterium]
NNCTEVLSILLAIGNPSSNITGELEYCASDNFTTLDAGNGANYKWSNNEMTQKIEVGEGTYTVTVTDSNNCTSTDEVTVVENSNPNPSISGNLSYCASANFTALDAGRWSTYKWSNGETSQFIEASAGTYTVTVNDSNGCKGTDEVRVIENPNPSPSITGNFAYCRGRQATLDAGNWSSYSWSNGETTQSFSTTSIGIYTVTVTNQKGCTGSATAMVSMIPCLAEAGVLTTNENTVCAGGDIEVHTIGEKAGANHLQYFFIYSQNNLGATLWRERIIADYETSTASADFSGLDAGDYLVCAYNECQDCQPNPSPITTNLDDIYDTGTVQDGCFDIECSTITIPEAFEANTSGTGLAAENNAAGQNIYIAEVCGGTAPYSIDFDSSGGFATVNDYPSPIAGCIKYQILYVPEADWTLTVTDANGCNNKTVVFTNEGTFGSTPLLQIVGHTAVVETCIGDADGELSIEVEGGESACEQYTYAWSSTNGFTASAIDGATGSTLTGLASGSYDVTVTDCEGTTTVRENMNVARRNRGRGRSRGGCKTVGNENLNENANLKVFPNPFTERTSIEFSFAEASRVWLSVYSIEGQKVAEILAGETIEGEALKRFGFDASRLQSGVYILELQLGSGERLHQKLMVDK